MRSNTTHAPPAERAMARGIRLGSVAGIGVYADWSLGIIVALVTVSLGASVFPAWHPDWGAAACWLTAIAAALLFVVSILLHELSHALVGRRHGVPVRRITLFVFGGIAELEREPHAWRAELAMAIVGPITSLVLGFVMVLAGSAAVGRVALDPGDPLSLFESIGPLATVLLWLGPINILLALFNLVPGFPLDGGRVLRALLWGATGDIVRATRWATASGRAVGWVLVALGFMMVLGARVPLLGGGPLNGIWLVLIGWLLASAATASYHRLLAQRSLAGVPVSQLMMAPVTAVAPQLPVATLIDEHLLRSDQRAFPVVDGDRLAGLVTLDDVRALDRSARAQRSVADVMTPIERLATVDPHDDSAGALQQLSQRAVNQLPVVENGRLRGLLRREDLLKWLSLRGGEGVPA